MEATNLSRLNYGSPAGIRKWGTKSQVTRDQHDASLARHELTHRLDRLNGERGPTVSLHMAGSRATIAFKRLRRSLDLLLLPPKGGQTGGAGGNNGWPDLVWSDYSLSTAGRGQSEGILPRVTTAHWVRWRFWCFSRFPRSIEMPRSEKWFVSKVGSFILMEWHQNVVFWLMTWTEWHKFAVLSTIPKWCHTRLTVRQSDNSSFK